MPQTPALPPSSSLNRRLRPLLENRPPPANSSKVSNKISISKLGSGAAICVTRRSPISSSMKGHFVHPDARLQGFPITATHSSSAGACPSPPTPFRRPHRLQGPNGTPALLLWVLPAYILKRVLPGISQQIKELFCDTQGHIFQHCLRGKNWIHHKWRSRLTQLFGFLSHCSSKKQLILLNKQF